MSSESQYYFDGYCLDVANRQLWHDGNQLELNGRYFDALVLLVENHGQLVEKDQFFSDVWQDVIVSDSALTQCIKDIRKQLGDSASNPQYIQTVPCYGYRFIGQLSSPPPAERKQKPTTPDAKIPADGNELASNFPLKQLLTIGAAGTTGGIIAGLLGGLLYGFGLAYAPGNPGMGAISMLLVLLSLNAIIGGIGGLGVSIGMGAGITFAGSNKLWTIVGGALGGLVVGGLAKLLGVDAFNLLFGSAPEGITGGLEGIILGAAVAFGAVAGGGFYTYHPQKPIIATALTGGIAGILISVAGGRLMGGSLELLTRSFTGSRLRLDTFGSYFGEANFGFITQTVFGGIEGLLFGACVAGCIIYGLQIIDYSKQINTA